MKLNSILLAGVFTLPALFSPFTAKATSVTGIANIAGTVSVSGSSIDFHPSFTSNFSSETGSFTGLQGGSIQSLTGGPETGATFVPAFATFSDGLSTPIFFDLTYIAPGVGTLADCGSSALGAACTPAGAPFTLFQLPSNTVIATLQLSGTLYSGSAASGVSLGTSIFNTQTALQGTIPQIVSLLSNGQALSGLSYSASFAASSVPEPVSAALTGFGFVVTGLIARRKGSLK